MIENQENPTPNLEITKEDLIFLQQFEIYRMENGIDFYEPIPKVIPFHKSEAPYRLLHGANRSSKSYSGGAEDVFYALGCHPYKKVIAPNDGWVVSPTYKQQVEGVQAIILALLPKQNIADITHVKHDIIDTIYVIPKGMPPHTPKNLCSKITFKSCDAGPKQFAGAAKRWIHFDEEPQQAIWKESIARIGAGMPLDIWLTMTPIFEEAGRKVGMTWTHREIYKKRDGKRIATFGVGIEDNIYLSREQVEEQKKKYHGAEYDIRIKGEFKLLAGNQVFDPNALDDLSKGVKPPEFVGRIFYDNAGRVVLVDDKRGYLKLWEMPGSSSNYAIGADIGLGVGGDPSVACVLNQATLNQAAEVCGQIPPDMMGEICMRLAKFYNEAWLGIEANSFGIAAIDNIKKKYPKLYYRYKVDKRSDTKTKQIGWWTDTKTKPIMIADMTKAIREQSISINSEDLLDELSTYVIGVNGDSNAEQGCHDDRVIACAIALQVRKRFFRMNGNQSAFAEHRPFNSVTGW